MVAATSTGPGDGPPAETLPAPDDRGLWSSLLGAVRGEQFDYTRGDLRRAVALLAVPMVLEMAMESLFAICDIAFVARLGDDAVTVVGLSESLMTLVYAVAFGLAMSVTPMVARRIGEGDAAAAAVAGGQAVWVGLAVGLALGIPCFVFGDVLLGAMGADPEVVAAGSGYTRIVLGCNVVVMLLHLHNAVFRGAGDAGLAMRSLWLANLVNLVLDPCLIFGLGPFPELGVTGAAVASTCGRGVGVLYQMRQLAGGRGRVRLDRRALAIDARAMWTLLRLSAGGIGQFLIATASWVCLYRIVSPFGSAAVAGYTVGIRILLFFYLPAWGLSNAAATLVGQSLGAGDSDRAARSVWLTAVYNMTYLGVVMAVCLAATEPLVAMFADPGASFDVAVDCLRIFSYGCFAYALGMVLVQAFNGAGDTGTPTWINFICFWLLEIPLAWVLAVPAQLGPSGVFWSVCLSETALAVLALLVFRRGRWKTRQV